MIKKYERVYKKYVHAIQYDGTNIKEIEKIGLKTREITCFGLNVVEGLFWAGWLPIVKGNYIVRDSEKEKGRFFVFHKDIFETDYEEVK